MDGPGIGSRPPRERGRERDFTELVKVEGEGGGGGAVPKSGTKEEAPTIQLGGGGPEGEKRGRMGRRRGALNSENQVRTRR